ncbi:hypothetical protein OC834_004269 [Tilletia horrida]|nr:hypothetical protein OC834_004269 [Tilletia horrida]
MEWNTELDLALRSVAWTPLRCADRASTADKVLLAKFHVDHGHGSGGSAASCCLLLFDCESGLAYFKPFRSSRLLKRCTFIDDGAELASSSHSQDSSDARTQAIVRRLERMFSPAAREDDRFETVFTVDGSRHRLTFDSD